MNSKLHGWLLSREPASLSRMHDKDPKLQYSLIDTIHEAVKRDDEIKARKHSRVMAVLEQASFFPDYHIDPLLCILRGVHVIFHQGPSSSA